MKGTSMNSKDVKGLAVIAIADGKKVGSVSHVFFDPMARKVVGFGASEGSGFMRMQSSGEEIIEEEDVHYVRTDEQT